MRKLVVVLWIGVLAAVAAADRVQVKPTNRQVIDRFVAVVDAKNADRLGEADAADIDVVTPMGTAKGLAAHKQMVKGLATAFPDYKHAISRCVESGDMISCEGKFTGTNTGPMLMPDGHSMQPTKKKVAFDFLGIARIVDGKVAELHVYYDNASVFTQLGVLQLVEPDPDADAAVAKMQDFTTRMCNCKVSDRACADRVNEDMTKWGTEMARKAKPGRMSKPNPDLAKKAADIMTRYTECMTKIMMNSSTPNP